MEHLREHWRQVTASRRTLYRGISLEGASRQYAWGLDQAIVRKFSSAMKKGDHQAAAKVVLDLCEQSGEFVEGGHFGVWWSTDHKVARGYAGMHTRETLGCVIHAEVEDDDINQGHAEQYGFTSEAPVVLRQGARIDIVAIEVRYNPDLKVLRDGDFVLIPVRRQVTAATKTWREKVDALPESYTPAIMSAVENVLDEGYSENDDEFWSRVYGEVMA